MFSSDCFQHSGTLSDSMPQNKNATMLRNEPCHRRDKMSRTKQKRRKGLTKFNVSNVLTGCRSLYTTQPSTSLAHNKPTVPLDNKKHSKQSVDQWRIFRLKKSFSWVMLESLFSTKMVHKVIVFLFAVTSAA